MPVLTVTEVLDLTPPGPEIEGYEECRDDPACDGFGEEPPYWRHYHPIPGAD